MSRLRHAILPAYLFLCLVVGGSSQAIWGNALLQVLGIAVLAWASVAPDPQPLTAAGRSLLAIIGLAVLLFAIQLVPLPPSIWTIIPGRQFIADGYARLGMALPWLPVSQAPYETMAAALTLLPPLALVIGMLRLRDWRGSWMLSAIILGTMASVLLGVLQLSGGDGAWYFYKITNLGVAVGAFANGNHFATLLLVAIPTLAALAASAWQATGDKQTRSLAGALTLAAAAALAIGAVMNSAAAFLLLGPPVAIASLMLIVRLDRKRIRAAWIGIFLLLGVAAAALVVVGNRFPGWGTSASIETRAQFWSTTAAAVGKEGLLGTGFGTFRQVYSRYEDPAKIDRFYVNHAHNDYLEIALEGGVPALLVLLLFVGWWLGQSGRAWNAPSAPVEARAATIASAAVLLHSLFDFPLRTAAIMATMAVFLAFLGGAKGGAALGSAGKPRARHATL